MVGTAGIPSGSTRSWALWHCRDTLQFEAGQRWDNLGLGTAGIFGAWARYALLGYSAVGY